MYRPLRTPLALLALLLPAAVLPAQIRADRSESVVLSNAYSPEFIPEPPTISMVSRAPLGFPLSGSPVAVVFRVTSGSDSVNDAEVKVCYRVDGGAPQCVAASLTSMSGDFAAMIPGQSAGAMVTYWISVPDVNGAVALSPSDTSRSLYFYRVLDTPPHIYDVQYTPNLLGTSGYVGADVTLTGVVTADTSDIAGDPATPGGAMPWVVIQDGTGPWTGLPLLARSNNGDVIASVAALRRGDSVTVSGTVAEEGGMTVLRNASVLIKHATVTLPSPYIISTDSVGQSRDGETQKAEQWEGVLICYGNIVVAEGNADAPGNNGEFYLSNSSTLSDQNTWTRVETDNSHTGYTTRDGIPGTTLLQDGMHFDAMIGILAYTSQQYKLIPRNAADYVVELVGVERERSLAGLKGRFVPNVVRGAATLELEADAAQSVTVEIVDAMGREVAGPVTGQQIASGTTRIPVDAARLASGNYRAVVRTNRGSLVLPFLIAR